MPGERLASEYVIEHAIRSLACDPRVGALDIAIEVEGDRIMALGQVETDERRSAIALVLRELFPEWRIENLVLVAAPPGANTTSEEIA